MSKGKKVNYSKKEEQQGKKVFTGLVAALLILGVLLIVAFSFV